MPGGRILGVNAVVVGSLPVQVVESSGIDYTGTTGFWTHNDGVGDNKLYLINNTGSLVRTITVLGAMNTDWEDITHDASRSYMYIGDFGNNNNDRTDLHIYKIQYPSLVAGTTVTAQVINFSYPDQHQFPAAWMNFDAESIIHLNGNLFIFSKSVGTAIGYTKMYMLPDAPGTYVATLVDSFYTNDRITSADISSDASIVALISNSHIHIFRNFTGHNFFGGLHTLINICTPLTKKEGIAFTNNQTVYMTDENTGAGNFLYTVDLSPWLPVLPLAVTLSVCSNSGLLALTASPSSGVWSGTGVTGNNFNPTAGTQTLAYTYTDATTCTSIETRKIIVNAAPTVSAGSYNPLCSNGNSIVVNGSPAAGTWSGTGLTGSTFNPFAVVPGSYSLSYSYTNNFGCTASSTTSITVTNCGSVTALNLKIFIEGYYSGNAKMVNTLYDLFWGSGIGNSTTDPTATDSIDIGLWSATHLSNPAPDYTARVVLHTDGTTSAKFPLAPRANYYIAVKHRNSLETWSRNQVVFGTGTPAASYDFTTGLVKAYTDGVNPPMKNLGGSVYGMYSGDINRDGAINILDMSVTDNDARLFFFGYNDDCLNYPHNSSACSDGLGSDCNGDGGSGISDMAIVDNNTSLFLFYARP